MIQFRDFLKDKEKEKQLQDHERYVKGCEETNRKRGDQENKWNQYYRDFDNKLSNKMQDYDAKYVQPLKEKEQME